MSGLSASVHRRGSRMLLFPRRLVARRLEGKTRGQALIYVSLMMMTLLTFGALVADGGLLFVNRRQMQNAVDAAALAAAQNLPMGPNDSRGARPIACDYATVQNGVPGMVVNCGNQGVSGNESCSAAPEVDILVCRTYVENDSVRVTARKSFDPLFGIGLGFATIEIRTQATAIVGSVTSAPCLTPLYQTEGLLRASNIWNPGGGILNPLTGTVGGASGVTLNTLTKMKTTVQDALFKGPSTLLLQVNGASGKSAAWGAIGHPEECTPYAAVATSGTVTTSPGNAEGQFRQNMQRREDAWNGQQNCGDPVATNYLREDGRLWKYPLGAAGNIELAPETCYRMMIIPLIDADVSTVAPTGTYAIRGFLNFYVAYWCGKNGGGINATCSTPMGSIKDGEIWGYYVGYLAAGGTDFQPYDGLGTKIVALTG